MKNIPEWQYPLYKGSDKVVYDFLVKLGKSGKYPKLIGSKEEINVFLKLLVLSQKIKDYRKFRDVALGEFKKKETNISTILKQNKNLEIPRGIDDSWAIFLQDKRLCELMDTFQDAKIKFSGTKDEISEFFVRFLLTQLLQDWRGPLMAVILECLQNKEIKVFELNSLLKIWDYTKIFQSNQMSPKYPKQSSLSPKVEIRSSPLQSRGMFAKELIKAGETVVIWGGDYVSKKEATKAKNQEGKVVMQLDDDLFTVENRGDDMTYFMDHSCDPNVWMKNAFTLVARRDISPDEELTADYILWEADENYIAKWECTCGSRLCRKKITGKDWRSPELQKRYKNHFTPLLNKRIKNLTKKALSEPAR